MPGAAQCAMMDAMPIPADRCRFSRPRCDDHRFVCRTRAHGPVLACIAIYGQLRADAAMFGFRKTSRDPLADIKTAERWLASFPDNDPLAMHADVAGRTGAHRDRAGVAAHAAATREPCSSSTAALPELRKTLTTQYIEHANRSSKIENQLWSALFDLTQAFLLAYQAFAREVSDHAQSAKWQLLLPGSSRGRSSTSGSTPRSGCTATSNGFRPSGRNCTRCSRSPARGRSTASRSSSARAAARRRSSTSS